MKSKGELKVGDYIHIYHMFGDSKYRDTEGVVTYISETEIFGTWGDAPLFFNDDWEIMPCSSAGGSK